MSNEESAIASTSNTDESEQPGLKQKMKKPIHFTFESNPIKRKRVRNCLLRKIRLLVQEFVQRIGIQTAVLMVNPPKSNSPANVYRIFGSTELAGIVTHMQEQIVDTLDGEMKLLQEFNITSPESNSRFVLPDFMFDGVYIHPYQMTQAQLRSFIPNMLKYSTGRGKPGWGQESTRPVWWPEDVPWQNIRMDNRNDEEKQNVSWTDVLKKIVQCCYKFHGREDLLKFFPDQQARCINESTGMYDIHNMSADEKDEKEDYPEMQIDETNNDIRITQVDVAEILPKDEINSSMIYLNLDKQEESENQQSYDGAFFNMIHGDDGLVFLCPVNNENIAEVTNFILSS